MGNFGIGDVPSFSGSPQSEKPDFNDISALFAASYRDHQTEIGEGLRTYLETEANDAQRLRDVQNATIELAKLLAELNSKIDKEHSERLAYQEECQRAAVKDEKTNRFRFILSTALGVLTLAAAIYTCLVPYLPFG